MCIFNVLFMLVQVNIVLGIFNLIPIPPLDGSRVLGAFLPRRAYEKWVALDHYGFLILILPRRRSRGPASGSLLCGAVIDAGAGT